jgi:hypothetical protein
MSFARSDWLLGSPGSAPWSVVAAAQEHARHVVANPSAARFGIFDESATADVAVIASQIPPSDDGPGAKEAGAIFVIDRLPRTFNRDKQDLYRNGTQEVREVVRKMFPAANNVPTLSSQRQFELLRGIEKSDFLTRCGSLPCLVFKAAPPTEAIAIRWGGSISGSRTV